MRQLWKDKILKLEYLFTEHMPAGLLTKSLTKVKYFNSVSWFKNCLIRGRCLNYKTNSLNSYHVVIICSQIALFPSCHFSSCMVYLSWRHPVFTVQCEKLNKYMHLRYKFCYNSWEPLLSFFCCKYSVLDSTHWTENRKEK